ncbi:MAG: DUF1553 domain-containing protein [Planctomycetes bacterium]|nr:DUF1553 domain-containing protein [Planctomycetota bacterium]
MRLSLLARGTALALLGAGTAQQAPDAAAPKHWAFVAPQKHVPRPTNPAWCRDELDHIVLAGIEAAGLAPAPEAEPAVLLRRAHLVLTGLPPTRQQLDDFLQDTGADAYQRRVADLLASGACAEHLATDWLDLARFADTYGYQADFECRTWPWRDWLIRSFAADQPWDQFVREILAGDLLPDATPETRTATAFWRLHRQTNEGGSIDEEWRHEYIADRTETFGTAFLGLTIGCARCHDHKSDPITQRDYYALGSFFTIDEAGLYPYSTGATPQPALRLSTPEQDAEQERLQQAVRAAEAAHADALDGASSLRPREDRPLQVVAPVAHLRLVPMADGHVRDLCANDRRIAVPEGFRPVAAPVGQGFECDGDARLAVPKLPTFSRAEPYSVRLVLWCPERKERAVLLHTSQYTEDADTQGYQLLLKDGRLCWEIVHHWPGSALAVRMRDTLPLGRWLDVVATYDGSSKAHGMALYVDGERTDVDLVRDHLAGPATVRQLELGGRDRDQGFAGGRLAEFALFDRALTAAEVATLAGRTPSAAQRAEHFPQRDPRVLSTELALRAARKAAHAQLEAIPELMVMAPHQHPPERFVLRRGAYDQPDRSKPVAMDVPQAVLPLPPLPRLAQRSRLHLADWLNDPQHPLAARVVVDRLWALCFGRGLVPTPENFGVAGERPAQQALLDALAVDFAAQRSVRAMLQRIVTSATFRQSSTASAAAREADPRNDRLARGPSFRLSAETLRDQALAASGLLHQQVGGPSVRPYQPPGLWRDAGVGWGGADYQPDSGPNAHRRSLYTYRKRTAPPPNLMVLDATSRESCSARRQPTDTPLQALVFWNDPVFTECASALAARVLAELPGASVEARVQAVFVSLAARPPRPAELQALRTLHDQSADAQTALFLVASTLLASDAVVVMR